LPEKFQKIQEKHAKNGSAIYRKTNLEKIWILSILLSKIGK